VPTLQEISSHAPPMPAQEISCYCTGIKYCSWYNPIVSSRTATMNGNTNSDGKQHLKPHLGVWILSEAIRTRRKFRAKNHTNTLNPDSSSLKSPPYPSAQPLPLVTQTSGDPFYRFLPISSTRHTANASSGLRKYPAFLAESEMSPLNCPAAHCRTLYGKHCRPGGGMRNNLRLLEEPRPEAKIPSSEGRGQKHEIGKMK
jgi:hypothetical protein